MEYPGGVRMYLYETTVRHRFLIFFQYVTAGEIDYPWNF
jgi:hypothetical protein